jgi:hypothetical protein
VDLRFFRRVRLAPGLRVNLSKSGASLSVGRRGMWWTLSPRGRRATIGAVGTGLRWTEYRPWTKQLPLPPASAPARFVFPWALFSLVVLSVIMFWALFTWLGGLPP